MGKCSLGVPVVCAVFLATPVWAHHAFSAEFDAKMPVTLQGTVTRIEMVNPHGWIYIDVKGPDGKVVNWAVETGGPNALARRGVKKGFLPIGQVVIVTGYRAKDMSNTVAGDQVKFLDGRNFSVGGSAGEGFPGSPR
jgi:Family of unknown function (DUF6152)